MKNSIPFYKMVASGNDFVVIDNRKHVVKNPVAFARTVCTQHTGVGADGVLLYEGSRRGKFKMRIINSDGSEAEACGNGFRCISLFAKEKMGFGSHFQFESEAGIVSAEMKGDQVCVGLPDPKEIRLHGELKVSGNRLHYSFINTGVPHVVIFAEGLKKINVADLGRMIRYHKAFQPRGTNVNFVEVRGPKDIEVRTYERGVENETLACGTGSTASAIMSSLHGYVDTPVRVKTAGSEILTINFKKTGKQIKNVTLQGKARFVYEGKLCQNGTV